MTHYFILRILTPDGRIRCYKRIPVGADMATVRCERCGLPLSLGQCGIGGTHLHTAVEFDDMDDMLAELGE